MTREMPLPADVPHTTEEFRLDDRCGLAVKLPQESKSDNRKETFRFVSAPAKVRTGTNNGAVNPAF